jgi:hypothetical protein
MKRLYVALTLLMMAFLSSLDQLDALHRLLARIGVQRWMTELVLAAAVAAAFAYASQLHRRMLFPRRGLRLLLVGIAVHVAGFALASGALANAVGWLPLDDSPLAALPRLVSLLSPLPLFIAAEAVLLVGVFRALTNLVPPDEFAEDF